MTFDFDRPERTPEVVLEGSSGWPSIRFWLATIGVGVASGAVSVALMALLRFVQHRAWSYSNGVFLDAVEHCSSERRLVIVLLAGVIVVAGRRAFGALPAARAPINLTSALVETSGHMATIRTLADSAFSIVVVALGASLGREGALKQAAAALAGRLSEWMRLPDGELKILVACGAGAGMAAAYNVPLGGAVFVIEVLLASISLSVVLPALATSTIATALSWIVLNDQPTYAIQTPFSASASLLFGAFIGGPIIGLLSVGFVRLTLRARPSGGPLAAAAVTLTVFALLALTSIDFPQVLGNGKNLIQLAYSDQLPVSLLLGLMVLKPLATFGCLKAGSPGGLFTPTMAAGALIGAALGKAWAMMGAGNAEPGSYAIIGSVALLAATTQGPVSAVVFMIELTHHVDGLIAPILVAVTMATLTAKSLGQASIYSARD